MLFIVGGEKVYTFEVVEPTITVFALFVPSVHVVPVD